MDVLRAEPANQSGMSFQVETHFQSGKLNTAIEAAVTMGAVKKTGFEL